MRKFITSLLLVLLAAYSVIGQVASVAAVSTSNKNSNAFVYTAIPSAPSFSSFTLIDPTDTNVQTADLGGNTDVVLGEGNHVPRVLFTSLDGSPGTPYRIKGENAGFPTFSAPNITKIGDNSITNDYSGKTTGANSEYVEFHQLWFYGGTGFKNESQAKSHSLNLFRVSDGSFAGILNKTDNNNTITPYSSTYTWGWFENQEGEFIYVGQVNGETFHNIASLTVSQCYGYNSGREGVQAGHTQQFNIDHVTMRKLGYDVASGAAQRKLVQFHDSNGTLSNSIFTHDLTATYASGQYVAFISSDGITFTNNLLDGQDPIYLANVEAEDWYANSTIKGNAEILFENNIIVIRQSTYTKVVRVFNDICNVRLKNNIIYSDAVNGLFEDGRIDQATYDLIDDGGNVIRPLSEYSPPTFDSQGRVTSVYYYSRGIGARTPD